MVGEDARSLDSCLSSLLEVLRCVIWDCENIEQG